MPMKVLLLIAAAAAALLVAPSAQAQSAQIQNDMTPAEFRQVFLDLGSYVDAHKGTDLRRRFEAIPESALMEFYPATADPRQLRSAVAALQQEDATRAAKRQLRAQSASVAAPVQSNCSGLLIDPSGPCYAAYPDPTNLAWQILVAPVIATGGFPGQSVDATDWEEVSSQTCSLLPIQPEPGCKHSSGAGFDRLCRLWCYPEFRGQCMLGCSFAVRFSQRRIGRAALRMHGTGRQRLRCADRSGI